MSTHLIHPDADELREILERSWPGFTHEPGTLVNESGGGAAAATADGSGDGVAGVESGEGETGDGEGEGEEAQGLTVDQFNEAFDSRFGELRNDLASLVQGEDGGEGQYADYGQDGEGDIGDPFQEFIDNVQQNGGEVSPEQLQQFVAAQSEQAVQQAMQEALPQALEQALAPIHDRFLDQDADRLEQTYPALQDPEVQQPVIQEALALASSLGQPELARSPKMIENAYLAWCARNGKTAAVPASGEDAALEGAGASNAGGENEVPIQDQIVASGGPGGDMFGKAFGR